MTHGPSSLQAALKSKCTNTKNGRWVSRSVEEEYLDRVRAYRDTEPYRRALRKRAVWVEPLFGEAKECHGLRRFRLRGLEKVNTEALLIASGQNVKRVPNSQIRANSTAQRALQCSFCRTGSSTHHSRICLTRTSVECSSCCAML